MFRMTELCSVMSSLVTEIFNTKSDDEEFMGFQDTDFENRYGQVKHISKFLADIFDAPSDEEFLGFPEEDGHIEDKLNQSMNVSYFQSKYITEELIKVFTEDSCSADVFEGFPSSMFETNGELDLKTVTSEMEDEDEGFTECDDDDEEEDEASSIESEMEPTSKKTHFGLHVAFKFPTRRPAKRKERDLAVSESESDDDSGSRKKPSNVLLKRAMNIKENKEMLAKLMAELKSMPRLFPVNVQTSSPSKQKRQPKKTFSEGKIERRMNPTRNARPPEGFSVEKFAISPTKLIDQVKNFRLRTDLSNCFEDGSIKKRRRRSSECQSRLADNITEEDLENIAITVKDKIYDRCMGSTCHQCRQKTIDTKTICHNHDCSGVRGQFCGPCLRNRYGENVRSALLNPVWVCPPCRGICNCSFCRRRNGRCATGILVHLAKFYGYDNVQAYLESLQKQLTED